MDFYSLYDLFKGVRGRCRIGCALPETSMTWFSAGQWQIFKRISSCVFHNIISIRILWYFLALVKMQYRYNRSLLTPQKMLFMLRLSIFMTILNRPLTYFIRFPMRLIKDVALPRWWSILEYLLFRVFLFYLAKRIIKIHIGTLLINSWETSFLQRLPNKLLWLVLLRASL